MTQAAPATKFEELQKRIVSAMRSMPSEFELRQLHVELKKLANADSIGSMELRARLACIEGDVEEAERLYRGVLKATGNAPGYAFNFLTILASTGNSARAFQVYREFIPMEELDPHARERVAQTLGFCGWAGESTEIRQRLVDSGYQLESGPEDLVFAPENCEEDDQIHPSEALMKLSTNHRNLELSGIKDSWIAERVGDAIQFFRSMSTFVTGVRTYATPRDDGSVGILVNFYVDRTPEEAAEVEWDMYGFMSERDPDLLRIEDIGFAAIGTRLEGSHGN